MNFAMYSEVDVFISNYSLLDPEVYQLWIDGCSSSEAVKQLHKRGVTQETGASYDLLSSDVADHYRTYSLLERLLHNPPKLAEQISFQLEPETKQFLIERYYEVDDAVIRELLGKKLSSRHRKDLDEVSDKTKVHLKSCRRQFDNVKRVYKAVEEMQGSVVTNIQTNFLLSKELAEKYGAVVFIGLMRFETSKRKLQYLTFSDFLHCARILMDRWTCRSTKEPDGAAMDDTDLDREFLLDMRELRTLLEKEKEHKHLVCQKLKPQLLERSYVELETNFRTYTRALVGMACGLHRGRERVRSFFLDMVERCIEPWKQVAWSRIDLSHFLDAYTSSALEMDVLREAELKNAWERYMAVMSSCLLRLYHS
ncbi:acidic fibroblast growth factor intracellular-binding protein [Ischnura elegans]|uniref:acidic fibroblast growth factor intracellular-binding protein n=1 Tax=Ischnura elegans TaxID=197161 RepID=UPI001ED895B8|nr:acidic fibroblast growth factor intracellular-binding protein [Ischnura elegans]